MKRLIPVLSLVVVTVISVPAEAQTLTRVNRSSVFSRAQSSRSASVQRSQQQMRKRTQLNQARAARTRQSRALQQMKRSNRLGARTSASAQTIVGTQREIAAQRRRAQRQHQHLSKRTDRGTTHARVIKRRLATEAEARMHRPKRVIR